MGNNLRNIFDKISSEYSHEKKESVIKKETLRFEWHKYLFELGSRLGTDVKDFLEKYPENIDQTSIFKSPTIKSMTYIFKDFDIGMNFTIDHEIFDLCKNYIDITGNIEKFIKRNNNPSKFNDTKKIDEDKKWFQLGFFRSLMENEICNVYFCYNEGSYYITVSFGPKYEIEDYKIANEYFDHGATIIRELYDHIYFPYTFIMSNIDRIETLGRDNEHYVVFKKLAFTDEEMVAIDFKPIKVRSMPPCRYISFKYLDENDLYDSTKQWAFDLANEFFIRRRIKLFEIDIKDKAIYFQGL